MIASSHLRHFAHTLRIQPPQPRPILGRRSPRTLRSKVNALDPGFTATDMNGHVGYRSVAQAAEIPLALATGGMNGISAGFLNHNGRLGW